MTEVTSATVSVRALPFLTPENGRIDITVDEGKTIEEIVTEAFPSASEDDKKSLRVVISADRGEVFIERHLWRRVRPRANTTVIIRVVPAGEKLRAILTIVVSVASIALGNIFGPQLAIALSVSDATAKAIIGLGTLVIGTLAINALIPVQTPPEQRSPKSNYQITGWQNSIAPDGVIPQILGKHRYSPPFAMAPYSEVIDDKLYINACFNFGYGPLVLSSHRIGETPLSDYDGVKTKEKLGDTGNNEMNMFPDTVIEHSDAGGIELIRPLPRNSRGEVIEGDPSISTPIIRTLSPDAKRARIIFSCPTGMIRIKDNGDERTIDVSIRIQSREVGETEWAYDEIITIWGKTRNPFYRQHEWKLEPRGLHEVRITRQTNERTDAQKIDRVVLVALQSIRPEYAINFDPRLCLFGVRIRSSDQLNGMLDSYSAVASCVCLDWDHVGEEWIEQETRNPASLFRYILQGPANAKPTSNSGIDLTALQAWHDFCRTKGLKYDRIHDFEGSLEEALAVVAAAGRAVPRHDGAKWSVVVDQPQTKIVDLIGPRNSSGMEWNVTYLDPPHAFRVPFIDRTNDYASAERIVPWPGHSGDITLTEQLDLPGKTDPDEIWVEARRRMYELIYRGVTVSAVQDGLSRISTRGDMVAVNHDALERTQKMVRVQRVEGQLVVFDDVVTMEEGESYGIRFQKISVLNVSGANYILQVQTVAGEHRAVTVLLESPLPTVGHLIHFGPLAKVSTEMIVQSVEPGENNAARLNLIGISDLVDEYTNGETPPEWSPRVGTGLSDPPDEPGAPEIERVLHGLAGTDSEDGLEVKVKPDRDGDVKTVKMKLDHKPALSGSWTTVTLKDGEHWAVIAGYSKGDAVQLRAKGVSKDDIDGPYTDIVDVTIGAIDDDLPADLDDEAIIVTGGLGNVVIEGATTDDLPTAYIQIYANQTGVLDREVDAISDPIPVKRRIAFSYTHGDPSRKDRVRYGDFTSDNPWGWTGEWEIVNGKAKKTAGSAGSMYQFISLVDAKYYRLRINVAEQTGVTLDGSVTPQLGGGGSPASFGAISTVGTFYARVLNTSGNDRLFLAADSDFNGKITEVALMGETVPCLEQGDWYYWLEPMNAQYVAGNVSGPFMTTVT